MSTLVKISNDPSNLSTDATFEDLQAYADNLQAHLEEHFQRSVMVVLDRVLQVQASDAEVRDYVIELHAGNGWLQFLP